MKPLISKCSMIPAWHQLVPISGHVEESETARKLQLYATSIKTSVSTRLAQTSRVTTFEGCEGNFGLELLPHGINMWTSYSVSGWGLCTRQRASWTYPPQVFTSVHLFIKIVRSVFTINSPHFQNNWVKIHHRKNKVGWRFTKLICFF